MLKNKIPIVYQAIIQQKVLKLDEKNDREILKHKFTKIKTTK